MGRPGRRGETTSTTHPSPGLPRATMLLPPADSSACCTPDAHSTERARSSAQPLPTAPKLTSIPGRLKATEGGSELTCTAPDPTCRHASSIASSRGTRASRRRKPQHRLSGVVVTSKAPSVSRCTLWQSASSCATYAGTATGPFAASRFTPDIVLVGMNTLKSCSRRSISSSALIAAGTKTRSAAGSVISNRQAMARRWTRSQCPHATSRPTSSLR